MDIFWVSLAGKNRLLLLASVINLPHFLATYNLESERQIATFQPLQEEEEAEEALPFSSARRTPSHPRLDPFRVRFPQKSARPRRRRREGRRCFLRKNAKRRGGRGHRMDAEGRLYADLRPRSGCRGISFLSLFRRFIREQMFANLQRKPGKSPLLASPRLASIVRGRKATITNFFPPPFPFQITNERTTRMTRTMNKNRRRRRRKQGLPTSFQSSSRSPPAGIPVCCLGFPP